MTDNIRNIVFACSETRPRPHCPQCPHSAMPAQHSRSMGLLCGRPVALELSTR